MFSFVRFNSGTIGVVQKNKFYYPELTEGIEMRIIHAPGVAKQDLTISAEKENQKEVIRVTLPYLNYYSKKLNTPEWLLARIIMEMVNQGNFPYLNVFKNSLNIAKNNGGFDWLDSPEGYIFWDQIINQIPPKEKTHASVWSSLDGSKAFLVLKEELEKIFLNLKLNNYEQAISTHEKTTSESRGKTGVTVPTVRTVSQVTGGGRPVGKQAGLGTNKRKVVRGTRPHGREL